MSDAYEQSILNKARGNKFLMTIMLPEELKDINKKYQRSANSVDLRTLQFAIYGTIVPEVSIPQEDVRYAGSTVNVSSHNKPTYAPVSINFTIDNKFNNYWVIFKWLNLLRHEVTGIYMGKETDKDKGLGKYSCDFTVTALDEFNQPVIEWTYKNAFPISLGEIRLSNREANEIETTFEFVFRHIETNLLV